MKKSALLSFLLLSACMVGPDYYEPTMDLPNKWANAPDRSQKKIPLLQEAYWWKNYKDPLLESLVKEALKANYDLKTAFANVCKARALLLGAEATMAPEIDATGSFTKNVNSLNTFQFSNQQGVANLPLVGAGGVSNRYFNLYRTGLTAIWEIDLFGRVRRTIESSEATAEAQIEDMRNTLLSLIADVALSYINLRGYQQQLEITQKSVKAWDSIYKLNQDLLKAGIVTDIDVSQAKASRDQAEAALFPLKSSIKTMMHQLAILVGKSPACLYGLLSPIKPIPHISSDIFAGLPSELLKRRPDIREAERKLAASTAQIGVAEASRFPTFTMTGSTVGYQSNLATNLFSPASGFFSFGPNFIWPIVDFGRVRANIEASIATRDATLYEYKSTILNALMDVENALVSYASEAKRLCDLENAYKASKRAADISLLRYQAGLINFITVLQAELTYQTNAITFIQSQTTLSLNSVTLYKALGGGWHEP